MNIPIPMSHWTVDPKNLLRAIGLSAMLAAVTGSVLATENRWLRSTLATTRRSVGDRRSMRGCGRTRTLVASRPSAPRLWHHLEVTHFP